MPIEALPSELASAFFASLRDDQHERAKALLDAHPAIAMFSVHTAAAVGNADALRTLLAADAAVATSLSTPDGVEPIIFAASGRLKSLLGVTDDARADVIRQLLDAGASPNACVPMPHDSRARIPALYFACVSNNVAAARVLLERGANPNDGESVHHAAVHNHRDCLDLLAAFGASLSDAHAGWGNTPLYFLAGYREHDERVESVTRGMHWLLEHGADPNIPSHVGQERDATPRSGEVPLHRLAAGRSPTVVRMFVKHGATVDAVRADGRTPYRLAVRTGNIPVADYLATAGAEPTTLDHVDRFLGACATEDEHTAKAILQLYPDLIARLEPADRQALHAAVDDNREGIVRLMLTLGWPVAENGEWGGTALHWAAWRGRPTLVRLLLEHDAPVNVRDPEFGSSPIAWACHGSTNSRADADYQAIVEMLLDAGATRAESFNQWHESPESMASRGVAEWLVRRGFTSPASAGADAT